MKVPFLKGRLTFQGKVLIPVIALLILLPAITLAIIHRSSMEQLQKEARQKLQTADAVFQFSLQIRGRYLLSRFKNIVNEPRFKAVSQLVHSPTMSTHLNGLFDELGEGTEFMLFVTIDGHLLAGARRDNYASLDEFEQAAHPAIQQALMGQPASTLGAINQHVLNAIAVPVVVNNMLVGALAVGERVGASALQELTSITRAEVVLISNGAVSASTLKAEIPPNLLGGWSELEKKRGAHSIKPLLLENTHYLALASQFPGSTAGHELGYVLLSSYEQALQQLRDTQAALWLLSSLGIAISALVIWFVIGRITAPLRQLRTSAEAVGAGDFSPRVNIGSDDEFGQLGNTFNQMTRNLQHSHAELQKTVETLKTTQAQLIQSEKLSAVGEFVAGIAHELNNPLTSVIGFAELLKGANLQPKHQNFLSYIVKSSERCHKIVQGLLSFARQHPPERKPVDANELIEGVLDILAYEMRTSNIEVEREFQAPLPKLFGDPHQLQQVFLNLLNNARQAMEAHQPSGRLRITTESNDCRVRIIFEDNGPGISADNLRKIFDPFFTTKAVGKGTGLGLSLCYGIINEHGGTILAQSEPGHGATFVIELPAHKQPDAGSHSPAHGPEHNGLNGSGRRVLVIDDEEWILELVRQILKRDGFEVDTARDGETAMHQLASSQYELLVCDWKMPGLSGPQLYDRISAVNPEASQRMIFMTGDVMSETFQSFLKKHSKSCLSKPFSVSEFRATVQNFVAAAN